MEIVAIKGGSFHAAKTRKGLMMMKAAKLGYAGPGAGQKQTKSRPRAKQEQGGSISRIGTGQEQVRSKKGAEAGHG